MLVIKPVNLSRPLPQYTLPNRVIVCNTQNTQNGHNIHPLPRLQNNEPVVISSRYNNFFGEKDTQEDILFTINEIWGSSSLFDNSSKPNSDFYTQYLAELTSVIMRNHNYFVDLQISKTDKKYTDQEKTEIYTLYEKQHTPFEQEFFKLLYKNGLNQLQKVICLTQALELSLMGVNVANVLENINNAGKKQEKNGIEKGGKKSIEEGTKGYRQELQAGWFLAKFIYGLNPSLSNTNNFIHLKKLSTIDRDRDPDFIKRHEKEADIFTEDALVSVKSYQNKYHEQIRDLFFMVIDDEDLNLKEKIKKIILIRCAENSNQYLPNYMDKREYKTDIRDKAIQEAKESILKYGSLTSGNEKHFRRLVSPQGIDIYFIPSVNDIDGTRHWIKKRFEFQDQHSLEKIA